MASVLSSQGWFLGDFRATQWLCLVSSERKEPWKHQALFCSCVEAQIVLISNHSAFPCGTKGERSEVGCQPKRAGLPHQPWEETRGHHQWTPCHPGCRPLGGKRGLCQLLPCSSLGPRFYDTQQQSPTARSCLGSPSLASFSRVRQTVFLLSRDVASLEAAGWGCGLGGRRDRVAEQTWIQSPA